MLEEGALTDAQDDGKFNLIWNLVSYFSSGGLIPLHNACSFGHADVAQLLLVRGANPNSRDNWNFSPLHEAAIKGKADVCIGKWTNPLKWVNN